MHTRGGGKVEGCPDFKLCKAYAPLVSGEGTKSDSPHDLPALQPPPRASEAARSQVLIPLRASLGSPQSAATPPPIEHGQRERGQTWGHSPSGGRPAGSRRARRAELPRWRREAGSSLKVALGSRRGRQPLPPTAGRPAVPASARCEHQTPGDPRNAHGSPAPGRKLRPNGVQAAAGGREGERREGAREGRTRNVSSGWRLRSGLRSSNWRLWGGPGNLRGGASELGLGL